eukprot:481166-Prorocentrum_minimum.AAC.3
MPARKLTRLNARIDPFCRRTRPEAQPPSRVHTREDRDTGRVRCAPNGEASATPVQAPVSTPPHRANQTMFHMELLSKLC